MIPEESENPSSEEPTLRGGDTFVVTDVNDFTDPEMDRNRAGTLANQQATQSMTRPPQREQTITSAPTNLMSFDDLIKPEKETKPEPKPDQPKKLEIPNVFLGQVKLKPVPQKPTSTK